jgi:hypothetical protein
MCRKLTFAVKFRHYDYRREAASELGAVQLDSIPGPREFSVGTFKPRKT